MNAPARRLPGIVPAPHKERSLRAPIRQAPLPPRLVIPLTQPGLAPPRVLVRPGDHVLKGQCLARGAPGAGITCHASSSGIVEAVDERPVPNASGLPEPCVTIVVDGEDRWIAHAGLPDYRGVESAALLRVIEEAGIGGLGGAGFPAHRKLGMAPGGIHTLVINACECEPFITADEALMRERAADILRGIEVLLHILAPERCLIGIEDDRRQARAALEAGVRDARIQVVAVPPRYPSGAERQLIWLLTGVEIPSGRLPPEAGIVCQNVGTVHAIARAVLHGEPQISRIVTLTGAALDAPGNVEARIGTPIDFLLAHCALRADRLSRLILGGPLMGLTLPHAALPVTRAANCVIATTEEELPTPPPAQACIRCGHCADVCPVRLLPQQLYWFTRAREHDKAEAHNLFDCIECGACAWVCPSHIPLVQYYRAGKAAIRDEHERQRLAERARQRFELREQRLAREKAQQEARQRELAEQARRKAAGSGTPDAIRAALERVKAKKTAQQAKKDDSA